MILILFHEAGLNTDANTGQGKDEKGKSLANLSHEQRWKNLEQNICQLNPNMKRTVHHGQVELILGTILCSNMKERTIWTKMQGRGRLVLKVCESSLLIALSFSPIELRKNVIE